MAAITTTHVLIVLSIVAIVYALWMMFFFMRENRRTKKPSQKINDKTPLSGEKRKKGDIVGKSRFVLPVSGQSPPEAAIPPEDEKYTKKENNFAPENVPEHPRQIAPDELDEVFGEVPEGETNEPLNIDFPLYESFPEEDAEDVEEEPDFDDEEDENEEYPFGGKTYAQGISFDELGDAYRQVVHNPNSTDEQQEETGRILLNLKGTDMFEFLVSGEPDREDKITSLIDTYLTAFHKRTAGSSAESPSPQGAVPSGFNVRDYDV